MRLGRRNRLQTGLTPSRLSKRALIESANRANPVVGDIFKRGSGRDTAVGIANRRVVYVTARAFVFHVILLICGLISATPSQAFFQRDKLQTLSPLTRNLARLTAAETVLRITADAPRGV